MNQSVSFEEAYWRYARGRKMTDGTAALEAASTVKEVMELYTAADRKNHIEHCKAAFSKALQLAKDEIDLDLVLHSLTEVGLTSYRYEVMRVFEKVDTLGLKVKQFGIKKQ